MTPAERRCAMPRFPWSDLALAPINGMLAAVPAVVVAGLPLYLVLWMADVYDPGGWAGLVGVGAFVLACAAALFTSLGGFLGTRRRIDDDLLDDEVEDRIVRVSGVVGIVGEPPAFYLRLDSDATDRDAGDSDANDSDAVDDGGDSGSETIVLRGDYLTRLRRTGCFPSTGLRLIQLPRSRAVVGILPMGETLPIAFVSGRDHRPTEFDGERSAVDFDRLRALSG